MNDETIGERIAALGKNLPAEALEHLATEQEAAHREYTQLRAENDRLRAALRLACQDLRGPGVPADDLVADYLRAVEAAPVTEP